jgi:class 3 adenylate cyclase
VKSRTTFDSQIERMVFRIRSSFKRYASSSGKFEGRRFLSLFEKLVPASHRPKETLIFLFEPAAAGGLKPVVEPGLVQENAKILSDIFSGCLKGEAVGPNERAALRKRIAGIFGEDLDFDLLALSRRGRLTPASFRGKPSLILWDSLAGPQKTEGACLIIFPFSASKGARPLYYALSEGYRRGGGFIPLLVPLMGEEKKTRVIIPSGAAQRLPFRKSLVALLKEPDRERVLPFGKTTACDPHLWVRRDMVLPDQQYELWVVGLPPLAGKTRGGVLHDVLGMLVISGWFLIILFSVVSGKVPALSMRLRMISFLAFLALAALSSLYLFGSYYLETAAIRKTQDAVKAFKVELEELDKGVNGIVRQHSEAFSRYWFDRSWCWTMLHAPMPEREALAKATFHDLGKGNPSISLSHLLVYRCSEGLEGVGFSPPEIPESVRRVKLEFFEPLVLGAIKQFQNEFNPAARQKKGRKDSSRSLGKFFSSSLDYRAYMRFMAQRQKGSLMDSQKDPVIFGYDFLTRKGLIEGVILFLANSGGPFQTYLQTAVGERNMRLSEKYLAVGKNVQGGFEPILPNSGNLWTPRLGRVLHAVMEIGASTQSSQTRIEEKTAWVAHSCVFAKGFILGGMISLESIQKEAEHGRMLLLFLVTALLVMSLILGWFISGHILSPLISVEEGLRKVAKGDLDTRLRVLRDDELGDLTVSFDLMIKGIQERRELGLFVSKQLELQVSQNDDPRRLGAGKSLGTVLVSDMRAFTTLSERYPPQSIVHMLNAHHQTMSEIILAHGGFVEMFIGDAVVAVFFDVAEGDGEGARTALACAAAMMRGHQGIQEERQAENRFTYEIGIGIDRGPILSGTIGTSGRLDFAVLGKARSRAELLEAASKSGTHSRIIVSDEVREHCRNSEFIAMSQTGFFEWSGLGGKT